MSHGSPENVITKENLEIVYNLSAHIMKNRVNNNPHIIPIGINL